MEKTLAYVYIPLSFLLSVGFIGGVPKVPGERSHLKTEPAGLCQARLQGNGVPGDTELCTQVRIRSLQFEVITIL